MTRRLTTEWPQEDRGESKALSSISGGQAVAERGEEQGNSGKSALVNDWQTVVAQGGVNSRGPRR